MEAPEQQDQRNAGQECDAHRSRGRLQDRPDRSRPAPILKRVLEKAADEGIAETLLPGNRLAREQADIRGHHDCAGDDELRRHETRKTDIAGQCRDDKPEAEHAQNDRHATRPMPARRIGIAVARQHRPAEGGRNQDETDDQGGDQAPDDGQNQRRAHCLADGAEEIVESIDDRHCQEACSRSIAHRGSIAARDASWARAEQRRHW